MNKKQASKLVKGDIISVKMTVTSAPTPTVAGDGHHVLAQVNGSVVKVPVHCEAIIERIGRRPLQVGDKVSCYCFEDTKRFSNEILCIFEKSAWVKMTRIEAGEVWTEEFTLDELELAE